MNEIKQYFLECCNLLEIKIEEKEDYFILSIPEDLQNFFKESQFKITFSKTTNPDLLLISKESYLLHKVAYAVSIINEPLSCGFYHTNLKKQKEELEIIRSVKKEKITKHFLYVWYKTTIQANSIEEMIKGMRYDFETEQTVAISESFTEKLDEIKLMPNKTYKADQIENAINIINEQFTKHIKRFIRVKQHEYNESLQKEIERINQYYKILQQENSRAESITDKKELTFEDEKKILQKEKEKLIEQQKVKFQISESQITIKPIAILLLEAVIEKEELEIKNESGNIINVMLTAEDDLK